jgi:hypothetical protein
MVAAHASLQPRSNAQLERLAGQSSVTLEGLQGCGSAVLRSEWFMPVLLPAYLVFWVSPAVRRRQFDALQRLDRCAVERDWLGRILAGSIGGYALALLAQSWRFVLGIPPRYGRAGGSLGC